VHGLRPCGITPREPIVHATGKQSLAGRTASDGAALHSMASRPSTSFRAYPRRLGDVPPSLRKTLTYDQGSEMAFQRSLSSSYGGLLLPRSQPLGARLQRERQRQRWRCTSSLSRLGQVTEAASSPLLLLAGLRTQHAPTC
jgi:hypothetical protein